MVMSKVTPVGGIMKRPKMGSQILNLGYKNGTFVGHQLTEWGVTDSLLGCQRGVNIPSSAPFGCHVIPQTPLWGVIFPADPLEGSHQTAPLWVFGNQNGIYGRCDPPRGAIIFFFTPQEGVSGLKMGMLIT